MKLAILIPALNEEKSIAKVIQSIPKNIKGIDEQIVIVVDDGSTDKTSEISKNNGAIVIKHYKNMKLGPTFRDGLNKAMLEKADILVTIDADGQFKTSEIPKVIEPILNNKADFVTGSRFIDKNFSPKNIPKIKRWGNKKMAQLISWATKKQLKDVSCGFRAYSKEAMLRLNIFGKFTYTQETILDLAYKELEIQEVPITVEYFENRKSRIASSLFSYGYNTINIIFRTIKNYRPLAFFGGTGLIIFLIGLIMDIFVLHHYITTQTFSPYKIIGFMGAFLNATGIMVFFIGILADLIDKIRLTQENLLYLQKKDIYYGK